jgi:hypothetical protein
VLQNTITNTTHNSECLWSDAVALTNG